MAIIVFAEQRNGFLTKPACEAISQGKVISEKLSDRLTVLLIGHEISSLSEEVKKYGPDDILCADDKALDEYSTETYSAVLTEAIKITEAHLVLMAHSGLGKDLSPRIAERFNAGLASDCIDIECERDQIKFIRPIYAGKIFAVLTIDTPIKIITIRPNNFEVLAKDSDPQVRDLTVNFPDRRVRVKGLSIQKDKRPELTEAEIVVSGGRGLAKREGFQIIERLADELGAAVGASRAAVDAGWRDQQFQVGQTGKVVTPKLYIACGISGAIQHIAGMGSSKCIVAVNNDPEANIMQVSDLAIKGDLYEILPELSRRLELLTRDRR